MLLSHAGAGPRRGAAVLLVVAALYGLPLALDLPLLDPDEGLHAAIALEMVEGGDWITPRFLGQAFLDKPILFFWSQALSIAVFGANAFAVRLPGLLFGLLGALAVGLLGRRLAGPRVGLLAGLFYATMALPLALHQSAVHDVALVPWTTLALLAFWRAGQPPPRGTDGGAAETERGAPAAGRVLAWSLAAGVWLGLAVLTKGVVGVALVGLAHALALLAFRRLRMLVVVGGLVALAVAGLLAAPWYVAMERANEGYLHYFFVERHLLGYTTSTQIHAYRPWWYYLPIVAGGGFPWIVCLPAAGWLAWRDRGPRAAARHEAARYAWIWLVSSIVFLSTAGSKLVTYVLPALPAVALLAAAAWDHALDRVDERPVVPGLGPGILVAAALGASVGPALLVLAAWRYGLTFGAVAWIGVAGAALVWTWPHRTWRRGHREAACAGMVAAMTTTGVVLLALAMPAIAGVLSGRDLARHLNGLGALPSSTWVVGERIGSVVFYLAPELRDDLTRERIVHVEVNDVLRMPVPAPDALVAVPTETLADVGRRLPLDAIAYDEAGSHRVYRANALHAAIVAERRRF